MEEGWVRKWKTRRFLNRFDFWGAKVFSNKSNTSLIQIKIYSYSPIYIYIYMGNSKTGWIGESHI